MEENKQTEGGTGDAAASTASSAPSQPAQSAQADLKVVADRAKVAAQGFNFSKLFEGRIDNMNYLYGAVASVALGLTLGMIPVLGFLLSLVLLVVGLGITVRRFHDINITGWAALVVLIPFLGFLVVIYLCWKKGDVAANPFGAAPDPKRDFFKAVLNT